MPTNTEDAKVWHRTEFAFASADPCQCYKHKTRNGNSKRCGVRSTVIGLTDPDQPGNDLHKLFCLDCWINCRDERTIINPAQQRTWDRMSEERMTLTAVGC